MTTITEEQRATLLLLARVQYLNTPQLMRMGVFGSVRTLRRHLKSLMDMGFVMSSSYGVQPAIGKLPTLYSLTGRGGKFLVDTEYLNPEEIKASKTHRGEIKAYRDYHHRTGLIDALLSILGALDGRGIRERLLEFYFRKESLHGAKKTTIELPDGRALEPDAVLLFETPDNRARLFLVEFYEDSEQVERIRKALHRHAEAIGTGSPSIAYGLNVGHRVLCVFRHEHTARAIVRHLHTTEEYKDIQNRFLCVTLDALMSDALGQWATPSGARVELI